MFGSCDWPWLSKAWTRDNNSSNPARVHSTKTSPLGRPFVVLLILAIAVLVPPRDVFGQTDANTPLVASYDEIEANNDQGESKPPSQHEQEEPQLHHHQSVPQSPPPNKMVDGGPVSKVQFQ